MIESLITAAAPAIIISYYIGGMKEAEREEGAAAAQVLLASYAMASEAMNIKTLNTVILASPRKNVEQSTGRILRVRPDQRQVHPIIVDIVDVHRMYRSQWKKRSAYYKKCTYNVTGTNNTDTHVKVEVEVDADSDSDSETKEKAKAKANGCLFIE
jgi:superfamily II DNA or RNA helicase